MKRKLKIAHVCNYAPGLSGMYGTVRDLLLAERALGHEAEIIDDANSKSFYGEEYGSDGVTPVPLSYGEEADIICWHHAMVEDWFNEPHRNLVLFLHGTPEFNLHTELYNNDRSHSLVVGLANMKIPKAMISMWQRHLPFWDALLKQQPVDFVSAWTDVDSWPRTEWQPKPDEIHIGMLDFWRLTREPFGLFMAIDYLRRHTDKKVVVDVWGITEKPNKTWLSVVQWLVEDDVLALRGNSPSPAEDIYSQCDMVLSMSTEETRVVREAYSMGVPVVCGREGLKFTKYCADCVNPERLAGVIQKCHDDLCADPDKMRNRLIRYAKRNFDVKKAAKAVCDIFQRVVDEYGSVNYPKIPGNHGVRMVAAISDTSRKLKDRLTNDQPTYYVRFGDGELLFMSGELQEGGGHKNSPELAKEIEESFLIDDPNYLVGSVAGMLNEGKMRRGLFARFDYDSRLIDVVEKHRPGQTLENAVSLIYQSVFDTGWLLNFLQQCIHDRKVLFIGGEHLCQNRVVRAAFDVDYAIPLPSQDAYLKLDEVWDDIKTQAQQHDIVICAAGMTANVIAKRLWNAGVRNVSFLDVGSLADAFAGQNSRTWLRVAGDGVRNAVERAFLMKAADIIVLSHKQEKATKQCFDSLAATTQGYRVVWVDNGSGDESIAAVKESAQALERCELIKNNENIGYSKAVNQGLRKVLFERNSEYVILLNNDVILTDKWKDRLLNALDASGFAFLGPLTSENNPQSLETLRPVIPDLPKFDVSVGPEERAAQLWRQYGLTVTPVDNMVSFFCVAFRRQYLEQIGFLDENLFAYGEDNDFCARATRLGMRFGIAMGTYVHHDHHVTSDATFGKKWIEEQRKKAQAYLAKKYK